jgi:hypothetical protein
MDRADDAVRRLHGVLARRVADRESDLDAIVADAFAAIRGLAPEQVVQAMRLVATGLAAALVESTRAGLQEAARLGSQASHDGLRAVLGSQTPPVAGWERAAQLVEARGPDGLSLSSRIHRQTATYRAELDRVLTRSLREGTSATEMARRLVDESFIKSEPIMPRAIRDLDAAVKRMSIGGGDGAYAAASRAAQDVRRLIERMVVLPRARHGMAPATEHTIDTVMRAVWKGRQDVAANAIRWLAHDRMRYQQDTVARTEMQRAYSRAFEEHAREVPAVEGLIWNTARDDDVCEVCLEHARHGVYSIDELPEMPAHPRCRCFWTHFINRALLPSEIVRRALAA